MTDGQRIVAVGAGGVVGGFLLMILSSPADWGNPVLAGTVSVVGGAWVVWLAIK